MWRVFTTTRTKTTDVERGTVNKGTCAAQNTKLTARVLAFERDIRDSGARE
jgi:hypothetical protein